MRFSSRFGLLVVASLVCGVWPCGAEEPANELQPIAPATRTISGMEVQPRALMNGMLMNGISGPMTLTPDGKTLILVNNNGLNLVDLTDRQAQPRTVEAPNGVSFQNSLLAVSADGKTLAIAAQMGNEDLAVRFLDLATGKKVREIENDQALSGLAFSPDGHLLAVGTPQRVELWDAVTGDEVRLFPALDNGQFHLLAFSPDGKMLAAVANVAQPGNPNAEMNAIHVWETASGKERLRLKQPFPPINRDLRPGIAIIGNINTPLTALTFSADSRLLLASGSDSAIHLWDLLTGDELPPLTGFRGAVGVLSCPTDGKELIAIVEDEGLRLRWKQARIRRNPHGRLKPLADEDFAELWDDLTEADAFLNYRARRYLAADPARTLPWLQRRLRAVPSGDPARLRQLLADLQSPNGGTRRKAMMALRNKEGEAALGALLQLPAEQANTPAVLVLLAKLQARYNTPEAARALKAVSVLDEIGTPEARRLLEKLAKGADGVDLTREAKAALDRLTARARPLPRQASAEESWKELASGDAVRAFRAVGALSLRPSQSVPLLRERLKPVPVFAAQHVQRLIADLEADDFKTRERARAGLEEIGEQGLPAMKKMLTGQPTLEVRKRIERLMEQWTTQPPPPVLRRLRALEVLEHVATADARRLLRMLAGGAPQARLTREAKASLERLARR